VQLLAARGATVVATGTTSNADRLTGLGATTVILQGGGQGFDSPQLRIV
jgi:hypothetical protein